MFTSTLSQLSQRRIRHFGSRLKFLERCGGYSCWRALALCFFTAALCFFTVCFFTVVRRSYVSLSRLCSRPLTLSARRVPVRLRASGRASIGSAFVVGQDVASNGYVSFNRVLPGGGFERTTPGQIIDSPLSSVLLLKTGGQGMRVTATVRA